MEAFRSTVLGTVLRRVWHHPSLLYADEKPDYLCKKDLSSPTSTQSINKETSEQPIVEVSWEGPNDPDMPKNWSNTSKAMLCVNVMLLTVMTYMGSSIYTLGIAGPRGVMDDFDTSQTLGVLGLSLYVIAYGLGPLLLHPIIEMPQVGKLPVYVITTVLFFAVQIATVYSPNMSGLLGLRFLAGLIGSPSLGFGGASIGDMGGGVFFARLILVWALGAVMGPTLGPVLGGFAFEWAGWKGTIWVTVMVAGLSMISVLLTMPESSGPTILYRKAQRLQKLNPNVKYVLPADLPGLPPTATGEAGVAHALKHYFGMPLRLSVEPTLLVYNAYLSLIYGLFYLFFESFPLIFVEVHGFTPSQLGLSFLGVFVGAFIAVAMLYLHVDYVLAPIMRKNADELPDPSVRLHPAALGAILLPISLFGIGWTGQTASVHWIVPIIFSAIFPLGAMMIFPPVLGYLGDTYREHQSAVYSLNDLTRSSFAGAFPLFAHAMFKHLGLGGASSMLGGFAILFIPAPFIFIKYDARIRGASRFTSKVGVVSPHSGEGGEESEGRDGVVP